MSNSNERNNSAESEKVFPHKGKGGTRAPTSAWPQQAQGDAPAVPEVVHTITLREDLAKSTVAAPVAANEPLQAARGSDDLMSKQQTQSMPAVDKIKGEWKQRVGAAKIVWGKLTDDELLKSEGREEKLAGLLQERYAITRSEADQQIRKFMASRDA